MAADAKVEEAWQRYLSDTRDLQGLRYEEVEPHAWRRLESALGERKPKPREKVGT